MEGGPPWVMVVQSLQTSPGLTVSVITVGTSRNVLRGACF